MTWGQQPALRQLFLEFRPWLRRLLFDDLVRLRQYLAPELEAGWLLAAALLHTLHRALQWKEHPNRPKVGVVGDVGLAGDDGDSLQPGQGDGEGDAHVGANPKEALASQQGCHGDSTLAGRDILGSKHPLDVGANVDVLHVDEGFCVVELDHAGGRGGDPEPHSRHGKVRDEAGRGRAQGAGRGGQGQGAEYCPAGSVQEEHLPPHPSQQGVVCGGLGGRYRREVQEGGTRGKRDVQEGGGRYRRKERGTGGRREVQ